MGGRARAARDAVQDMWSCGRRARHGGEPAGRARAAARGIAGRPREAAHVRARGAAGKGLGRRALRRASRLQAVGINVLEP